MERGGVDFDHVYFKYADTAAEYVLSDICLHIAPGQTVGILGGTGSAKTSLVQLIPRLYDVSGGTLRIDGIDVKDYPVAHLRDAVGMVLQKNTLFTGTIRENLLWGNEQAGDKELAWACPGGLCLMSLSAVCLKGTRRISGNWGRQCFGRAEAAAVHCPGSAEKA